MMKVAKFAGERWNRTARKAAKAQAAADRAEVAALRVDVEKLKKAK